MSRAYRIAVTESLTRHVEVGDGVCTSLELLEVLPPERMGSLLGQELAKLGFELGADGKQAERRDDDGLTITVGLDTGDVTVRVTGAAEVDVETRRTATPGQEEAVREAARADLERQVEARREVLRREVTERLARKLGDLRQELDRAATRATAAALKERAAQLGEIEEITEDPSGSLTIRVRV